MTFAPYIIADVFSHATREQPRECCGLVVEREGQPVYMPGRNLAAEKQDFILDPRDYAAAEDRGTILAVAHSHVHIAPQPSPVDLVACEKSKLPWLIVNWPIGSWFSFAPTGYKAPYLGRAFAHGVQDCYTLIQDWYERERQIVLPDFAREPEWWTKGQNLYMDNFEAAGFRRVDGEEMLRGDVLIMQVGGFPVPIHGGVYLGDGSILHHPQNRRSSIDVFGGYWKKCLVAHLRYKEDAGARHSALR